MTKAVFISYAHEDSVAAGRIANTLRASGIVVWFDSNELRGGDAWDAVIRRQIRECTLFIPIISAGANQRHEGYFRREWRLAIDRTQDMSETVPFLMPVVIDDTGASADVPDVFKSYHWTRLPGGECDETFTLLVRDLLDGKRRLQPSAAVSSARQKSRLGMTIGVVTAIAVSVATAVWYTSRQRDANSSVTNPGPIATANISDQSIAVLPFSNIGTEKEDAYFADGVYEDIVTQLTQIGALHVASVGSAKRFAGETPDPARISRELSVRYVMQGSVRRAGSDVRVTVQLTDASTAMTVWAENFDRKLDNIFALQSDIARQIASQLKAKISSEESANLDRIPTTSIKAYDDYLKARAIMTSFWVPLEVIVKAAELLDSATKADPKFVEAWSLLSTVYALHEWRLATAYQDRPAGENYEKPARDALKTAESLNPNHIATYRAEGYFHLLIDDDYVAAARSIDRAVQLAPSDTDTMVLLSFAYDRAGQQDKVIETLERAYSIDPGDPGVVGSLRGAYSDTGRFPELLRLYQDQLQRDPLRNDYAIRAKYCQFLIDGKLESFKTYEASLTDLQINDRCDVGAWKVGQMVTALLREDFETYTKDWTARWKRHYQGHGDWVCPVQISAQADYADILIRHGRTDEAHKLVESSLKEIEFPQNSRAGCTFDIEMIRPRLSFLAGDPEEAMRQYDEAYARLAAKKNDPKKYFEKEVLLETACTVIPEKAFELYQEIQRDPIRVATLEEVCANPWTYAGLFKIPEFEAMVRKDGRFVDFLVAYGYLSGPPEQPTL